MFRDYILQKKDTRQKKKQSWEDPEIHFGKVRSGGCLKILDGVFEASMFMFVVEITNQ